MEVTACYSFHLPGKAQVKVKKNQKIEAGDELALVDNTAIKSPFKAEVTDASAKNLTICFSALEIKGKWGSGGQKIGDLVCFKKEKADLFDLIDDLQDKFLALSGSFNRGFWHKAACLGLTGVAALDWEAEDLKQAIEEDDLSLVVWQDKKNLETVWPLFLANEGKKVLIEGNQARILIPQ